MQIIQVAHKISFQIITTQYRTITYWMWIC